MHQQRNQMPMPHAYSEQCNSQHGSTDESKFMLVCTPHLFKSSWALRQRTLEPLPTYIKPLWTIRSFWQTYHICHVRCSQNLHFCLNFVYPIICTKLHLFFWASCFSKNSKPSFSILLFTWRVLMGCRGFASPFNSGPSPLPWRFLFGRLRIFTVGSGGT